MHIYIYILYLYLIFRTLIFYTDVHSVFKLSHFIFEELLVRTFAITINLNLKSSSLSCIVNTRVFHLIA